MSCKGCKKWGKFKNLSKKKIKNDKTNNRLLWNGIKILKRQKKKQIRAVRKKDNKLKLKQ